MRVVMMVVMVVVTVVVVMSRGNVPADACCR